MANHDYIYTVFILKSGKIDVAITDDGVGRVWSDLAQLFGKGNFKVLGYYVTSQEAEAAAFTAKRAIESLAEMVQTEVERQYDKPVSDYFRDFADFLEKHRGVEEAETAPDE